MYGSGRSRFSIDFGSTLPGVALGDLWNRTLVYFGIAEEDDDWEDEDGYTAEESLEQTYRERPNVRRLTPRRRSQNYDDWTESEEAERTERTERPERVERQERVAARAAAPRARGVRHMEAVPNPGSVRVHLVLP